MDEQKRRITAIKMHLEGKKIAEIARELDRSRAWFYKWLRRYEQNPTGDWYEEESRRPKVVHRRPSPQLEEMILKVRDKLVGMTYAQTGAVSIQWELKKLGVTPLPQVWQINRVLKRGGRILQKEKTATKRRNDYPGDFISTHQMDLVGPRYIKGSRRFYCLNIMATETHLVGIHPIPSKAAENVISGIIPFWIHYGIPDFLQMDNELSFHGSHRYPHSFGKLIRFVLSQRVSPIFIPLGEPWRNGIIEHFNRTFDQKLFRQQRHPNYEAFCRCCAEFEEFHNMHHRYQANGHLAPIEAFQQSPPIHFLEEDYVLPDQIPLEEGTIYLIRFIRSDRKLSIFSETFLLPKECAYNYVIAIIVIENFLLKVYLDHHLIAEFSYVIPADLV